MHGREPVARAFLSSGPAGAEENGGKGLVSIRHQLEEVERVVAAKQKHVGHPEGADDFRPRLPSIDALDGEIDAVACGLDVPVVVEAPAGARRELALERPERLGGRRQGIKQDDRKQDGRGRGRSKPHVFYPTRFINAFAAHPFEALPIRATLVKSTADKRRAGIVVLPQCHRSFLKLSEEEIALCAFCSEWFSAPGSTSGS